MKLRSAVREETFDYVVLAVPSMAWNECFPTSSCLRALARFSGTFRNLAHHRHSSVVRSRDYRSRHAVLLDRTIQWMFHKSKLQKREQQWPRQLCRTGGQLIEDAGGEVRQEIIDWRCSELREFFPAARDAKLLKATVIKEVHATYSPRPGIEAYRPRTGNRVAARISGGRLDRHRLARHHGRRGAQRLPGGAVGGAGGRDATRLSCVLTFRPRDSCGCSDSKCA